MENVKVWGGHLEMHAMATLYKKDFVIFDSTTRSFYHATENSFKHVVMLCYTHGNHYDAVYSKETLDAAAFCQLLTSCEGPVPHQLQGCLYQQTLLPSVQDPPAAVATTTATLGLAAGEHHARSSRSDVPEHRSTARTSARTAAPSRGPPRHRERHGSPRDPDDSGSGETLSRRAKPHSDSATPPATPAVNMEVTVEGHTVTAQELQSDDWTPVIYKAYASRPANTPKPPQRSDNATSEAANPNARNAAPDAAAATSSGKTPARLPPATKEARLTVQRSKQLPPLPPNAIRVVVRPRGEVRLLDIPTPRLSKAVQTQLQITLLDDFCLRIHPTNNTSTMATTHFPTAETLKTLTSLTIGDRTYPCAAYVAPPPGAARGVITNAFDDETPMQLYQDLVRRNPEHTILAARRMGKTHSILITFDASAVPNSIKYMGAIHRCTQYRGSPEACTNCRQPGHRHDVCPSPKTNLCPRCGIQHPQQEPPCTPNCILCEGPHLTGTGSCKGRNLHQTRKQPSHPQTRHQELITTGDNFPQLSPNQHKQAWTAPLKQAWDTSRSSHKHMPSMTATPNLQHALAKSQEEAAAAKAEATAARKEAAALHQHIAKLETQISALASGSPIPPAPAPAAYQPPTPNPPTAHTLPSHSNPTSSPDLLAMEADTEPSANSTACTAPTPPTATSRDDIPTLLESFAARFEAKLQAAITHINQECATLKNAVIHLTQDNTSFNQRLDVLTQGFSDRCSDLESQLNSYSTALPKRDPTPNRRKKAKATEGNDNPMPVIAHDSHPPVIPSPAIDSHDGSSKP
ncbi:uncharacterized protein [Dermacentor albipictus]